MNVHKTLLKNAEIKSTKELILRMIDGEIFYTPKNGKIYYDETIKNNPFVYEDREGDVSPLNSFFTNYEGLKKEVPWWDMVEFPVLCKDPKGEIINIIGKHQKYFLTEEGSYHKLGELTLVNWGKW